MASGWQLARPCGWLGGLPGSDRRTLADGYAGLLRIKLLTIGLIWQFVLAMIILYRKEEFLFCGVLLHKKAGLLGK